MNEQELHLVDALAKWEREPCGQLVGSEESSHRDPNETPARIRAAIAGLERCVQRVRELVAAIERAGRKVMGRGINQRRNASGLER